MAYWKPASYKSVKNRRRQWALLAALEPDIALLQECRPADLTDHTPSWVSDTYVIFGSIPTGWTACSAVLVKRSLDPSPVDFATLPDSERRWLEYFSGYLAFVEVPLEGRRHIIVSVHTVAKEVDDEAITEVDHRHVSRTGLEKAWHN